MRRISLWILSTVAVAPPSDGYEITTHALITAKAFDASTLHPAHPNTVTEVLGFDRLDDDYPFSFLGGVANVAYRDEAARANPAGVPPAHTDNYVRVVQQQERAVFETLVSTGHLSGASGISMEQQTRSWLMRGAIREDDNDVYAFGAWHTGDKRDPDPFGNLLRAARHFYDPIHDRAFDYPGNCAKYTCVRSILWAMGRTDPLHPANDLDDTTRRNHFTWQDARNNEWWALTLKRDLSTNGYDFGDAVRDGDERMARWTTAIKSLGHVIHLLQDTAQPQHVRNDAHAPPVVAGLTPGEGIADAAFEAYTDYRVVRDFDTATEFTIPVGNPLRRMVGGDLPPVNSLPPIRFGSPYPGGGDSVQFSTPVEFFTTRGVETGNDIANIGNRRGLADISNRNFFTSGTLPGFRECQPPGTVGCVPTPAPTYALPPNDLTDSSYTRVALGSGLGLRVRDRIVYTAEFTRAIVDSVAPSYDATALSAYGGKAPLVTESIWQDLIPDGMGTFREELGATITYNNMRYMADVMVPRAVGYSAGMIDFFFRGRLKVEPPVDGLFAVTDHGIAHTVDADGYPRCTDNVPPQVGGEPPLCQSGGVYGFTKLRVKLRNDTPAIIESGTGTSVPQTLSATVNAPGPNAPRLVAVARYHRNRCYLPNLSGENTVDYAGAVTPAACPQGNRTAIQEISVSLPEAVSAADLNGANSAPVTFNFSSDPIPINATDLVVQVVYRGPLGDESDGIAVGHYDVREPTWLTLWNNSDHAGCNGNWVRTSVPGCAYAGGTDRSIGTARLCIGSQLVYTRFSNNGNGNILLGHYARVAALLDDQPKSTRGRLLVGTNNELIIRSKQLTGQVRQAEMEHPTPQAPYAPEPLFKKRGIVGSFRPMPSYLIVGADPQPANDAGSNDVGALPLPLAAAALADTGGVISFPNTPPAPLASCTSAAATAYFDDEIEAEATSMQNQSPD